MVILPKRKFQIFVSSTFNDLKSERQEAVSAILKAGHIPAGMELFTAESKSQLDVIKRWIEESDIYVLILGTRYGAIEPISNLSYTEFEYDYALSLNKPIFSIVLNDEYRDEKLKSLGMIASEQNNSALLVVFRKKVMSVMCSLVNDIKDIKGAVYENLIEITSAHDLVGWVSAEYLEDTRSLRQTINNLELERDSLQISLDQSRINVGGTDSQSGTIAKQFRKLNDILLKKIYLPAEISSTGKEEKRSIVEMLIVNRNLLIKGWIIANPGNPLSDWFGKSILADLVIHRLITITKVHNGARYEITEKGLDFLAWIDSEKIDKKAQLLTEEKTNLATT